jgi:hypothetical protein
MRTACKVGLSGLLVFGSLCGFAASVPNFPPNPVGEKLYRTQLYHETLLPVVVLVCVLLFIFIAHRIGAKHDKPAST